MTGRLAGDEEDAHPGPEVTVPGAFPVKLLRFQGGRRMDTIASHPL
jgi:hypothetical protein